MIAPSVSNTNNDSSNEAVGIKAGHFAFSMIAPYIPIDAERFLSVAASARVWDILTHGTQKTGDQAAAARGTGEQGGDAEVET